MEQKAPEAKKPTRWKKGLRWLLGILLGVLLLLVSLQLVFLFFSDAIIGSVLKTAVEENSNRVYHLEYDSIQLDLANKKLYLSEVKISPDSLRLEELRALGEAPDAVAEVYFPSLELVDEGVSRFYFTQKLRLKHIHLQRPELTVFLQPVAQDTLNRYDLFQIPGLFPVISNYLKEVSVGEFALRKGKIWVKQAGKDSLPGIALNNFNLVMEEVRIDSNHVADQPVPFDFESFEVDVRNNRLLLDSCRQTLEVEQFWLGYPENKIEFWGVKWAPESLTDSSFVQLKDITLMGVDLAELYLNRHLKVENLEVSSGSGRWNGSEPAVNAQAVPVDPNKAIERYLRSVEIERMMFNNMGFSWQPAGTPPSKHIRLEDFVVLAQGFRIDSNANAARARQLFSDNVDLVINDFERDLPDGLHRFAAEELIFSTTKREITGTNLSVVPRVSSRQFAAMRTSSNNLFRISVPDCRTTEVNLWEWYNDGLILAKELELNSPKLVVVHRSDSIPRLNELDIRNLYPLIEGTFSSVKFQKVDLNDGQIRFEATGPSKVRNMAMNRIHIDLDRFQLDDRSYFNKEALFYSDAFKVRAGQGRLLLADSIHQLNLDNLMADSRGGRFQADAFQLAPLPELLNDSLPPDPDHGTLDLQLRKLRIDEFDYREAYYEQAFNMDLVRFEYPSVVVRGGLQPLESPKLSEMLQKRLRVPLVANYISNLAIADLEVDSANIDLFSHWQDTIPGINGEKIYLCVRDLSLDTLSLKENELLFAASDVDLRAGGYGVLLDRGRHRLLFKKLLISQDGKTIQAGRVDLRPIAKYRNLGERNVAEMELPGFRLEGIDIMRAYRDREVEVSKVMIERPEINLMLSNQEQKLSENRPQLEVDSLYRQFLEGSFENIAIDTIELAEGSIDLLRINKDNITTTSLGDISVLARQIYIDSSTALDTSRFFFAKNIDLRIRDYQNQLADSIHLLEADEIRLSTEFGGLGATNLHIHPKPEIEDWSRLYPDSIQKNLVNVFVPELNVEGIQLREAILDKRLIVDSIEVESPQVEVRRPSAPVAVQSSDGLSIDSIRNGLMNFFEEYNLGKIRFSNGFADLGTQCLPELEGEVINFMLDSNANREVERPLFADDWNIGMQNYRLPVADGNYEIQLGDLHWSTNARRLKASQVALVPATAKYDFAPQFFQQTDWINLTTEQAELVDLDFDGLFYDKRLRASELVLDSMRIEVFRDKRFPMPKNQRPKLPQQLLKELEYEVWLDSVSLKRSYAQYEEHAVGAPQAGIIYFSGMNAKFYSLTNDTAYLNAGGLSRLNAKAYVMGQGLLMATFDFDLGSANNAYTYKAQLGPMDLVHFNPMMENLAFVKIKKGRIKSMDFNVTANDDFAIGRMRLYYRNLKVNLIDPNKDKPGFKRSVGSAFANSFVVNTANPNYIFPRTGNIYFERRASRSIFNYWAYTAFSGLKSSVGHKTLLKKPGKRSQFIDRVKFKSYSWE